MGAHLARNCGLFKTPLNTDFDGYQHLSGMIPCNIKSLKHL